jgi:dynein heavy chain
LAEI